MPEINQLNKYVEVDAEKARILDRLTSEFHLKSERLSETPNINIKDQYLDEDKLCDDYSINELDLDEYCQSFKSMGAEEKLTKYCPKCGDEFGESENFCPNCLVSLKDISDKIDVKTLNITPELPFEGNLQYSNILTEDKFSLIKDFDFTIADFEEVLYSIRLQGFKNLDKLIKDNDIILDDLDILDKVLLFVKSFVIVKYKSYGETLGYFELNRIYVDDRQRDSLQITTLIHELSHFLLKEILTRIICIILDCSKNKHIECVVAYILNYSILNELIDEYAAHSVEGRFTVFGYQDYSSFIALQGDLENEYVEMAKTIGNTFSIYIKDMLEGFIDWDLRREIKDRFLLDTIEQPNYNQLKFENCNKLSPEGFMMAIGLMLEDIENVDAKKVRDFELEFQ